jgi:hypothetical protein
MKHFFTKHILAILGIIAFTIGGYAQTPTISNITGEATSIQGGETDVPILGLNACKSGGGTSLNGLTITFSSSTSGVFTNIRLYKSTNTTFTLADALMDDTPTVNGNNYTFSFPNQTLSNCPDGTHNYFVVADVDENITTAVSINASITASALTISATNTPTGYSGSATGPTYNSGNITPLSLSITNRNTPVTHGVATDPLIIGSTEQAVLGFALASTVSQNVSLIRINFDADPTQYYTSFTLAESANDLFEGLTTDNAVALTSSNVTDLGGGTWQLELELTTALTITTTVRKFFLVVDTDNSLAPATDVIEASLNSSGVTVNKGSVTGSATGINYDFDELTLTINNRNTPATHGVAVDGLVGGSSNQAILGFALTSNATEEVSVINVKFNADPDLYFTNYTLYESTDNISFDNAVDSQVPLSSGNVTDLGGGVWQLALTPTSALTINSLTERRFFVVVNVSNSVTTATNVILASLTAGDLAIIGSSAVVGSATGINYDMTGLELLITNRNTPATHGVAPDGIAAGAAGRAILGFALTSNGSQDVSSIKINFNADPDLYFTSYSLVESTDNIVFEGTDGAISLSSNNVTNMGGGVWEIDLVPTSPLTMTTTERRFFLAINVDPAVSTGIDVIQATLANTGINVGGVGLVNGSATGINYDFVGLQTTVAAIGAGVGPVTSLTQLEAGQTQQVLAGFSIQSNGTQTLDSINFNISGLTSQFSNISLYRSTNNSTVGTSIVNGDLDGNFNDLSGVSAANKTIEGDLVYYYLVVDVLNTATTATTGVSISFTQADIGLSPDGTINSISANRSFTFTQSRNSNIILSSAGGNITITDANTADENPGESVTTGNSAILATFTLQDGGGSDDSDGHPTILNNLTLQIENPQYLDRIALFDNSNNPLGASQIPAAQVNWTDLNYSTLTDRSTGGTRNFTVRATFKTLVTDNEPINVTIIATTSATGDGSLFAETNAGGATTTTNQIEVVANKLVFINPANLPATNPVTPFGGPSYVSVAGQPGDAFSVTVVGVDENLNVDLDANTVSVTLNLNPATATFGGTLTSTLDVNTGVHTFSGLTINQSGLYEVEAKSPQIPDGNEATQANGTSFSVVVSSAGIQIGPGSGEITLCKVGGSTPYEPLPDIVMTENEYGDFGSGGGQTFLIVLPSGWEFETNDTIPNPTMTASPGGDFSSPAIFNSFLGNTIAKFTYNVSGTTKHDVVTISGLRVRNLGGTSGVITRGGTGVVKGCCDDSKPLGILTSAPATSADFTVESGPGQPAISPDETNFSNGFDIIILNGEVPDNTPVPTNEYVSFSGQTGVGYEYIGAPISGYRYTFNPKSVATGNGYPVSFTYTDPSTGCLSEKTKTFTVYGVAIDGLLDAYCISNNDIQPLSVDPDNVPDGETHTGTYSISFQPNYINKYISNCITNNDGTLTITTNLPHGLVAGESYPIYISGGFSFPITILGFTFYTYGSVNRSYVPNIIDPYTFTINANAYGAWYGYGYVQYFDSGHNITSVTNNNTSLTITLPNHGIQNGAKVEIKLDNFSIDGGLTNRLHGWYSVSNVQPNTFDIAVTATGTYVSSTYNEVSLYTYQISQFRPRMSTSSTDAVNALLNSKLSYPTQYRVGFFSKKNGCPTCIERIATTQPVKLNPLPIPDFEILKASYCSDDPEIQLMGTNSNHDGTFTALPNQGLVDNGPNNNTAQFNPSNVTSVNTVITITYTVTDINGCIASIPKQTIVYSKPEAPVVSDSAYCQGYTGAVTLNIDSPDPNAEYNWYDNSGLTPPTFGNGTTLNTGVSTLVPTSKTFYITQVIAGGCESLADEATVTILEKPSALFSTNPGTLCAEKEFTVIGATDNGTPYPQYVWDFGDNTPVDSVKDNNVIKHTYFQTGTRDIRLDVTSINGCTNSSKLTVGINPNPIPNFTYRFVCKEDDTEFTGEIVGSSDVTSFSWVIRTTPTDTLAKIPQMNKDLPAPSPFGGTVISPTYQFFGQGEYLVTVTAYNSLGCYSDTTKQVTILEVLSPTTQSPYSMQNLDGGQGFWRLEDIAGNSTWQFINSPPSTPYMNVLGSPTWVTNPDGNYLPGENSVLNSPCFNITGVSRPTISIDFVLNTDYNRDGVVLEYSINGGMIWKPLAVGNNSGLNWFNTPGFVTAPIGASSIGWSGNSWELEDNVQNSNLVKGRHALNNILDIEQNPTQVRFRLAFESDSNGEYEGFGFNDFRVESRNRLLLTEHFTNENDGQHAVNKVIYDTKDIQETAKIQYHVSSPNQGDANSKINTADQTARVAYYGIALTEPNIPRTYVDGYSNGPITNPWATTRYDKRSLLSAPVLLKVDTAQSEPGYLKAKVTITALEYIPNAPINKNIVARIAVVEKTDGNSNQYVFRKFISSPIGIPLYDSLPILAGDSVIVSDSILIEQFTILATEAGLNDLAFVAFIQDDASKDIWQSAINSSLNLSYLSPITKTEDPTYASKINLYPNPANQELNVVLPAPVARPTLVNMVDAYGKVAQQVTFNVGEQHKPIRTAELAAGVYVVQIGTPEGGVVYRKVMVTH